MTTSPELGISEEVMTAFRNYVKTLSCNMTASPLDHVSSRDFNLVEWNSHSGVELQVS